MQRNRFFLLSAGIGIVIILCIAVGVVIYTRTNYLHPQNPKVTKSVYKPTVITHASLAQLGATDIPSGYHLDSIDFDEESSNQFSFSLPVSSIEIGLPSQQLGTYGFMVSPDGQKWFFANKPDALGVSGNILLYFKDRAGQILIAKGPTVTCGETWTTLPIRLQGKLLILKDFKISRPVVENLSVQTNYVDDPLAHTFYIGLSGSVPHGFSLVQLEWKSSSSSIKETKAQLFGSTKYFFISGDGENMGFIYDQSMVGETGRVLASFSDGNGQTFVATSSSITLK